MSKLYNKYLLLKSCDASKYYLFKSGIFYIFLDEDARKISSLLGLKLTNLNENIVKCGFPSSKLSKYIELLNNTNILFQIVDENLNAVTYEEQYLHNVYATNVLNSIMKLDINKTSPIDALNLLCEFKKILQGDLINEK